MKIFCPHCGAPYDVDDTAIGSVATCESCWKDFTVGEVPPPPPPRPVSNPSPTATRCPFCGGEIAPGVKKCRHCGEWLEKTNKVPTKALVVIGLIVLLIIVIAIAVKAYNDMKNEERDGVKQEADIAKEQSDRTEKLAKEIEDLNERLALLRSQTNLSKAEREEEARIVQRLKEKYRRLGIEYKDVVGK